ncbi:hypothetical protein IW261DRAFT_1425370 [Armillaria novae-zelandiae]|uniref:Uncharacterized protein n=1 Tax=Armillaria novae-zelandiae TaxID=153914 RepID=A0AA39NTL8_9AGAR|nr:hypothetical protein IW261DRAFT_1425370 [Armillaria novae-zelandiae]
MSVPKADSLITQQASHSSIDYPSALVTRHPYQGVASLKGFGTVTAMLDALKWSDSRSNEACEDVKKAPVMYLGDIAVIHTGAEVPGVDQCPRCFERGAGVTSGVLLIVGEWLGSWACGMVECPGTQSEQTASVKTTKMVPGMSFRMRVVVYTAEKVGSGIGANSSSSLKWEGVRREGVTPFGPYKASLIENRPFNSQRQKLGYGNKKSRRRRWRVKMALLLQSSPGHLKPKKKTWTWSPAELWQR